MMSNKKYSKTNLLRDESKKNKLCKNAVLLVFQTMFPQSSKMLSNDFRIHLFLYDWLILLVLNRHHAHNWTLIGSDAAGKMKQGWRGRQHF